jgi:hypothetical protein
LGFGIGLAYQLTKAIGHITPAAFVHIRHGIFTAIGVVAVVQFFN